MKDLKEIYSDMMTANPSEVTKFKWGETSESPYDGCIYVWIDVKMAVGDLCLSFECEQDESFESFKDSYMKSLNELISRIKWEFEPMH